MPTRPSFALKPEKAGYYFVGLLILALAGFWPSYFAKFIDGTADFEIYFHFHATIAMSWILFLIAQPILIYRRKLSLHKSLGRFVYLWIPLFFLSVILLSHSQITGEEENLGRSLWITFKDLFLLTIAFFIAIRFRHQRQIHARGMIAAGLVFIEPALVRLISNTTDLGREGYLLTIVIVYSIFITLIVAERKQKQGRWVFPLMLVAYFFVHGDLISGVNIPPWQHFANWFAELQIT